MRSFHPLVLALALLASASPSAALVIGSELVTAGLDAPVFVGAPPGDQARLFVVEQNSARIRIVRAGQIDLAPFLDIAAKVSSGGERGLLGLAFHPDYDQNGLFFVNYTDLGGDTVIERYQVSADSNLADPASASAVLSIDQPFANHNGGHLAFGPGDGYLYIGTGDGGAGGDPGDRAQSGATLLGKMLRIDVNRAPPYAIPPDNPYLGEAPRDEIWAFGLRNPWRYSFDSATGDLWIGDVGQNLWEEIDFQSAASQGGENYGWRLMEGAHCFNPPSDCNDGSLALPIHEYGHGGNPFRCSVTGGYVYRGPMTALQGTYFYADYCSAQIWTFRYQNGQVVEHVERSAEMDPGGGRSIDDISSFGEDAAGNLYLCDRGGELFRVVPRMELDVDPLVGGQSASAEVGSATPGGRVYFAYSVAGPGETPLPPLGVSLELAAPRPAGSALADADGVAGISGTIPPAASGAEVLIQAVEQGAVSEVVSRVVQ